MKTENIYGFNVILIKVEDFLKQTDDKKMLEIVKVDGRIFLHRLGKNELYVLSKPEVKDEL